MKRSVGKPRIVQVCTAALGLLVVGIAIRSVLVREMILPQMTIHQDRLLSSVAMSSDGRTVFSGTLVRLTSPAMLHQKADVLAYNAQTGQLQGKFSGMSVDAFGVLVSPDGNTIFARNFDGATAWDRSSRRMKWQLTNAEVAKNIGKLKDPVEAEPISISPDGQMLAVCNSLFAASDGHFLRVTGDDRPSDLGESRFTPDGKLVGIIDGYDDNVKVTDKVPFDRYDRVNATSRLQFWRTDTGAKAIDLPFTKVGAFDISRDGKWCVVMSTFSLADGGIDGSVIRRVDLETGKAIWSHKWNSASPGNDEDGILNSVVVSPNGKYVVAESTTDRLIIVDAATGREIFRPYVGRDRSTSWGIPGGLAFSEDGKCLVSRHGRNILVWDASRLTQ